MFTTYLFIALQYLFRFYGNRYDVVRCFCNQPADLNLPFFRIRMISSANLFLFFVNSSVWVCFYCHVGGLTSFSVIICSINWNFMLNSIGPQLRVCITSPQKFSNGSLNPNQKLFSTFPFIVYFTLLHPRKKRQDKEISTRAVNTKPIYVLNNNAFDFSASDNNFVVVTRALSFDLAPRFIHSFIYFSTKRTNCVFKAIFP